MAYEEGSTAEEREKKRREEAKRKLEEARLRRERERQTQTQVDKTREEAAYARGQSQANVQVDKTREEARPVGQQTAGQRGYDPRFDDPDYGKSKQENRPRQQQQAASQQSSLSSLKPPEEREQITASTRSYEDAGMTDTLDQRRAAERDQAQQEARRNQPETQYRYYTPTVGMQQQYQPPQGQIQTGGLSSLKPPEERQALYQGQQAAEQMGMGDTWNMQQQAQRNFAQEQARYEQENPQEPGQSWGEWGQGLLNQAGQAISGATPDWLRRDAGNFGQSVSDSWNSSDNPLETINSPLWGARDTILESPAGQARDARNEERWKAYYEGDYSGGLPTIPEGVTDFMGALNPQLGQALEGYNTGADTANYTGIPQAVGAAGGYVRRLAGQAFDTVAQTGQEFIESNPTTGAAVGTLTGGLTDEQQSQYEGMLMGAAQKLVGGDWKGAFGDVWNINVGQMSDMITNVPDTWNKYQEVQERIENSSNPDAQLAQTLYWSGPEAMNEGLNKVENRDADAQALTQQSTMAYQKAVDPTYSQEERDAYALQAAQLEAQANKLRNKPAIEMMDESTHVLRELGPAIMLDPLDAWGPFTQILGISPEILRMKNAQALFDNASVETAVDLGKQVQKYLKMDELKGVNANGFWDNVNPLADTPLNRAMEGLGNWYTSTAQLMNGVDNQADAQRLLQTLINNPGQLVGEGVTGLTSPGMAERAVDGVVKFGVNVVGNENLLHHSSVLAQAAPELAKVSGEVKNAKTGAITFDMRKFLTGVYNAYQNAAIDVNGVRTTKNALEKLQGLEKAFLSFNYLGMRPANWVQNAGNAAMTTMVDGGWTWASNAQILDDLGKKGNILSTRLGEAFQGIGESVQKASQQGMVQGVRGTGGTKSWWGKTRDFIYNIPYGTSPIGEETFYLKNYGSQFNKAFGSEWKKAATGQLAPQLEALGLDPTAISRLTDFISDVGINGSMQDVQKAVRDFATGNSVPFSLKELGVPEGALSGDAVHYLYDLIRDTPGLKPEEYKAAIEDLMSGEMLALAKQYHETPASLARHDWMDITVQQDGGEFIDDMVKAGQRAGMDPNQARAAATGSVKQRTEAENLAYGMLQDDLVASNPQAMGVATDAWSQIYNVKSEFRLRQSEMFQKAAQANTPQAWNEYYAGMNKMWGEEYTKRLGEITDAARTGMNTVANGGQVAQRTSSWDWVEKMARLDEQEINQMRQAGLDVGSWQEAGDSFSRAIQASRDFVDSYANRLYTATKRFATNDSLDIVLGADKDAQRFGHQVAAAVSDLYEQAQAGTLSWEKFYQQRNQLWYELADTQAARYNIAVREIVESHAAQLVPSNLRWTDDFAGGEFQLQRIEDGVAYAKRLDDGSVHKFNVGDTSSGRPDVPQNVLDDYEKLQTGQYKDLVDNATQEIFEEAKAFPTAGEAPSAPRTVERVTPPTQQQLSQAARDRMSAEAMSARESRTSMRAEWDRVAKAELGLPGIDAAIMNYRRDGVINFGDNFPYEDLLGKNIGGYQLDTQADVERMLTEYSRLSDMATDAEGTMRTARQYERMTPQQLYEARPDAFQGFTADDVEQMTQEEALSFVNTTDNVEYSDDIYNELSRYRQEREANPYDINKNGDIDWGGTQADKSDALTAVTETSQVRRNAGNTRAPEMGELAAQQAERLQEAYKILTGAYDKIVNAPKGQLTEGQGLRLMDEVKKFLGPAWDNTVAMSDNYAKQMANFAMLDATDTKNLDKWISSFVPYHFFGTRTMKNWAERTLTRPDVAAIYYDLENAVERENQQSNVPTRMQGSIPIPWTDNWRIQNPMKLLNPFSVYHFNDFATPEEANNTAALMSETAQMFGFGPRPTIQFGVDMISGYNETGSMGGAWDYATQQTNLSSLMPAYKQANYVWQWYTGEPLPGGEHMYDQGNVGRELAIMVQNGDVAPDKAKWAIAYAKRMQEGVGPLPEEPKDAQAVWEKAAAQYGMDKTTAVMTAYLSGLSIYEYDPAEQQLREMSPQYGQVAYNQDTNPMGSAQAQDELIAQNPALPVKWAGSELYPGSDQTGQEAGVSAATSEYFDKVGPILDSLKTDTDDWLLENPNATMDEFMEFQKKLQEPIHALNEQFPSVGDARVFDGEGGQAPRHRKGESPYEKAMTDIETVLYYASNFPGEPTYPGKDADKKVLEQYYADKLEWENKRLNYTEKSFGYLINSDQLPATPQPEQQMADAEGRVNEQGLANDITASHVVGQYAADLLRGYKHAHSGTIRILWQERIDLAKEATSDFYNKKDERAVEKFGEGILELVDSYPTKAKGGTDADRRQWRLDHGEADYVAVQDFYDYRNNTLGGNFDTVARGVIPDGGFVDFMQTYPSKAKGSSKEERSAWWEQAKAAGYTEEQVHQYWDLQSEFYRRQDEAKASGQFGDNIDALLETYVSKARDPEGNAKWIADHGGGAYQQVMAFFAWNEAENKNFVAPSLQEAWGGTRPYGSDRQPIGGEGAVAPPMPGLSEFAADPQVQADIQSTYAPGGPMGPPVGPGGQPAQQMGPPPQGQFFDGFGQSPTGQEPPLPQQPVTPQQMVEAQIAQAQRAGEPISPEVLKAFMQTPANQPITAFGNPPTEQKETSGEGGGTGTGTGTNSTVLDAWKKWLAENGGGGGGRGYGGGGGGGTSLRTFASVRNELLNRALYVQMGMREYRAPQLPNYYLADKSRNLEPGRMEDWLRFTRIKLS